jgi:hypothetical protein
MRFGWSAKDTSVRIRGVAKLAAVLFIAIYTVVYVREPFSDVWNNILANLLLVIAAAITAGVATMIWVRYDKSDVPRSIWRYFAIGLWLWVIAEVTWGYLNITQGEVSEGIADVFWVAAYIFFAQALARQYRILAQPSKRELLSRVSIVLVCLFGLYILLYRLLITWGEAQSGFGAAVNSFYPVADLFLAGVAIFLVSHFRGGAFARPWLGLLAFSFTDLLYAWIEISGIYSWSVDQANSWSTVFDIAYVGAYLVLGLGILSQWAFLKYGLRSPAPHE